MSLNRHYSLLDRLCLTVDQALRTLHASRPAQDISYPAKDIREATLTKQEKVKAAAVMRVNHTGEICAQGLYHGQMILTKDPSIQKKLAEAAEEEGYHLAWCKKRLAELNNRASYLNLFWYSGAFCIGLSAGMIGDKWSLGFIAETEKQVVEHLYKHIHLLPEKDEKSRFILQKMVEEEAHHREDALKMGGAVLSLPIKKMMKWASSIMVNISYWC